MRCYIMLIVMVTMMIMIRLSGLNIVSYCLFLPPSCFLCYKKIIDKCTRVNCRRTISDVFCLVFLLLCLLSYRIILFEPCLREIRASPWSLYAVSCACLTSELVFRYQYFLFFLFFSFISFFSWRGGISCICLFVYLFTCLSSCLTLDLTLVFITAKSDVMSVRLFYFVFSRFFHILDK